MPAFTNSSAARTPAGPAPMTTTLIVTASPHAHTLSNRCRACTNARAAAKQNPTILAGPNQAKAASLFIAKLKFPERPVVQQQCRENSIAFKGGGLLAINLNRKGRTVEGADTSKLAKCVFAHNSRSVHPCERYCKINYCVQHKSHIVIVFIILSHYMRYLSKRKAR